MSSIKQEVSRLRLEERCVCETCLSSGRRLVRLDTLRHIYTSVLSDQYIPTSFRADGTSDINICWECTALLKKILQFKLRAARAQEWLEWARSQQDNELILPETASVSSLRAVTKASFDLEIDTDKTREEDERTGDAAPLAGYQTGVSKVECDSDEFTCEAEGIQAELEFDKDLILKLEPPDADGIFAELPVAERAKKRPKKAKVKSRGVKEKVRIKKEVKTEREDMNAERKKRPKANPFDAYTVTKVSNEEVVRHREEERRNVWYLKSPHKCSSCIYGFRSEAQYNKHLLTNHSLEAGNFVCNVCETRTPTKQLLDKHLKIHHERYVCNSCAASFSRIHTMRQHYTAKHKSRKCKHCTDEFFDLKSLRLHRRATHLNYQCDKCGKKTTSRYTLKKHLRTHEPYPCLSCEMVFTKKKNLDQHVRNRHETRASEAYCVECDRQFASRPSYLLHVTEKHSPAVRFRCPVCDKPFNRKVYMKNHYNLMHLKKTNYYCKLCDKYICRKDGLRKHIEFVHEGKRLPKNKMCDICGRGFSTNKTLIHHRRTHTGERPHQCEYCTAAFAQITALKTHVKHIHLQLKRTPPGV